MRLERHLHPAASLFPSRPDPGFRAGCALVVSLSAGATIAAARRRRPVATSSLRLMLGGLTRAGCAPMVPLCAGAVTGTGGRRRRAASLPRSRLELVSRVGYVLTARSSVGETTNTGKRPMASSHLSRLARSMRVDCASAVLLSAGVATAAGRGRRRAACSRQSPWAYGLTSAGWVLTAHSSVGETTNTGKHRRRTACSHLSRLDMKIRVGCALAAPSSAGAIPTTAWHCRLTARLPQSRSGPAMPALCEMTE